MARRRKVGSTDEQLAELINIKARVYARNPALREWSVDDLVQEMRLVWLLHGGEFENSRGDLTTFADVMFNNHLLNMIKAQETDMRDHRLCTHSLDDPLGHDEDSGLRRGDVHSPESYFNSLGGRHPGKGQVADMRVDVGRSLVNLPKRQRELAVRLAWQTVTEAAKSMGISRETATVWRGKIREAFKAAGLVDYLPGTSGLRHKKVDRTT